MYKYCIWFTNLTMYNMTFRYYCSSDTINNIFTFIINSKFFFFSTQSFIGNSIKDLFVKFFILIHLGIINLHPVYDLSLQRAYNVINPGTLVIDNHTYSWRRDIIYLANAIHYLARAGRHVFRKHQSSCHFYILTHSI